MVLAFRKELRFKMPPEGIDRCVVPGREPFWIQAEGQDLQVLFVSAITLYNFYLCAYSSLKPGFCCLAATMASQNDYLPDHSSTLPGWLAVSLPAYLLCLWWSVSDERILCEILLSDSIHLVLWILVWAKEENCCFMHLVKHTCKSPSSSVYWKRTHWVIFVSISLGTLRRFTTLRYEARSSLFGMICLCIKELSSLSWPLHLLLHPKTMNTKTSVPWYKLEWNLGYKCIAVTKWLTINCDQHTPIILLWSTHCRNPSRYIW